MKKFLTIAVLAALITISPINPFVSGEAFASADADSWLSGRSCKFKKGSTSEGGLYTTWAMQYKDENDQITSCWLTVLTSGGESSPQAACEIYVSILGDFGQMWCDE